MILIYKAKHLDFKIWKTFLKCRSYIINTYQRQNTLQYNEVKLLFRWKNDATKHFGGKSQESFFKNVRCKWKKHILYNVWCLKSETNLFKIKKCHSGKQKK